jgi:hypothetical protein
MHGFALHREALSETEARSACLPGGMERQRRKHDGKGSSSRKGAGGQRSGGRCTRRGNADRGYRSLESASDAVVVKLTELTPLSPLRILPARNCAGSAS